MSKELGEKPSIPEVASGETDETKKEGELSPERLRESLSSLKTEFGTDVTAKAGVEVVFPSGTKIGDVDVSGKSISEVFDGVLAKLEHYEPPETSEAGELAPEQAESTMPEWLQGNEDLIWKGSHDNPTWMVQGEQYGEKIIVSYLRRSEVMKPGKTEYEQGRDLEGIHNSFSMQEWRIIQKVFEHYDELENQIQGDDSEKRRSALSEMRQVFREENAFRKGKGETPEIITNKLKEIGEGIARTTRGFKLEDIDMDSLSQKVAEILSQLLVLNNTRGDGKDRVPKIKPDIKDIPSFSSSLSNMANILQTQLETNKGMGLILGEPGTGKNEAIERMAAATNRPYFWFPCGRGMEAVDLVQHYEFDSKEGTKRFMTDLAKGLQTPGAIVYIDEVNALKKEVQAILHGIGDSNRSLNYDGVQIPLAEGVVVIIGGNPATLGSAGDLGEALLNRTRGQSMVMEYPALKKGDLLQRQEKWSDVVLEQKEKEDNTLRDFACDEVRILYPQLDEFSGLDDREFEILWDVVINESTQGTRIAELEENSKLSQLLSGDSANKTRKALTDLRDILEIADKWRQSYEKRSGSFELIGVSMRDTIAIVNAYKQERDVRKAYLRIMDDFRKNPIEGLDVTFKALERLIEDILGNPTP